MQEVKITFQENLTAVAQEDFNTILVVDPVKAVGFIKDSELASFTGTGKWLTTDRTYKELENISQQVKQNMAAVGITYAAAGDLTNGLNALGEQTTNQFLYVVVASNDMLHVTEVKDWCGSNQKILIYTPLLESIDATNGVSVTEAIALQGAWNSENAVIALHPGTLDAVPKYYNFATGWLGKVAPQQAGGVNWAYKQINGAPINYFDSTDQSAIQTNAKVNWMADMKGVYCTRQGISTNGSYIDIVVGKYWMQDKIEGAIAGLFVNYPKIPFTSEGRGLIKSALENVLQQASVQGIIVQGSGIVSVPTPSELLVNDRLSRVWRNIKMTATIQGAVNAVEITFVLNG